MDTIGRGTELKQSDDGDQGKVTSCIFNALSIICNHDYVQSVKEIMKSVTNVRNDRAKKEQAAKWSKMPQETKSKVIKSWEQKANNAAQ